MQFEAQRLLVRSPWLPWLLPPVVGTVYAVTAHALCGYLRLLEAVPLLAAVPFDPAILSALCLLLAGVTWLLYRLTHVPAVALWAVHLFLFVLLHYVVAYALLAAGRGVAVAFAAPNAILCGHLVTGGGGARSLRDRTWRLCSAWMPLALVPQVALLLVLTV